jgi:hypothetical protein
MNNDFFSRHGFKVLLVITFLAPLMLVGTRRSLQSTCNDVKSWMPEAYEETALFKWYQKYFGGDAFVMVSWEGCTLDSPALSLMAKKLQPPPVPENRPWPTEPEFFSSVRTGKDILQMLIEEQGLEPDEALDRLRGFLIGPDGKQTCLILTISQRGQERWEAEWAAGKQKQKFLHAALDHIRQVATQDCAIPESQLHMGGPPVDNVAIDVEGQRSLYRLAGVSAVVGILMAWWCLRHWGLTYMVFTTGLFTAGCSLVAVYLTGGRMNAILLTMPSLVYVAAVSGAIHLANYYRDTVRQYGLEGAATRAVKEAWLPLFLATATTGIGLASMYISELVPIQHFGLYSALGVGIGFVIVCTYMPAMLQWIPIRSFAEPKAAGQGDPVLSQRWRSVGQWILRRWGLVVAGCLVLMAIGAYGVRQVETSVKLMRLFSPKARIIQDYAWLEKHLGPLVPMEVVLRVDPAKSGLDTLDQLHLVEAVRRQVGQLPQVGSVLAATTFTRPLPERPGLIERRTWNVRLERSRKALADFLQAEDQKNLWRISARVEALTDLDYAVFIQDIQREVEQVLDTYRSQGISGIEAVYTGLVPLIYKAQHSLLDNLILGFVGDLILICVAMVFLMRSFTSGLLLAIPCLFPLAVVFGTMGLAGIVVDTGTVMTPAVAFGVTVDDAIHFMLWCRHGQQRGMNRREAIMFAYEDCARAIYQSWGVIGLGLSAFAFSSFTPTKRFGILMLAMLTASSFSNLVFLPALLASPLAHFFWKGGEKALRKQKQGGQPAETPKPHFAAPTPEMQPIGESAFPQKEEKFLGGPHFLKKIQENSETSFSLSRPVEV